jgi:aminobenzoyl-glutamate utilization protein A
VICGLGGYAATEKFDAILKGAPSHAGAAPHGGKNALLAAATAALNLYAIPRHGGGATRINVGRLEAGSGRNVIPAEARLMIETRGASSGLSEYMYARARQVLEAAAAMYGCELEIRSMGSAPSADSDPDLTERLHEVARQAGFYRCHPATPSGGSEDLAYFMRRVQEGGGKAVSIGFGADLLGISLALEEDDGRVLRAHTDVFDFDERVLRLMVRLLTALTVALMGRL